MKKNIVFMSFGFVLVCISLFFFFYRDAKQKEECLSPEQKSSSITLDDNSSNESASSNINQENNIGNEYLINLLYDYIPYNNDGGYEGSKNAYQDKLIKATDLDKSILMVNAVMHSWIAYGDGGAKILSDTIRSKISDMYNIDIENKNLLNEFYFNGSDGICMKKTNYIDYENMDNEYEIYDCSYNGGPGMSYTFSIRTIGKYEMGVNSIVIYDKQIFVRSDYNEWENSNYKDEFFTSSTMNKKVSNSSLKYTKDGSVIDTAKFIKDNYDKMISYKHTFKKNSDGAYYWYSTELA